MELWQADNVLLMTDLDGTLLTDEKQVTACDQEAIARFRDSGGHFTFATGRSIQSVQPYLEQLAVTEPVILYNGACIYDVQQEKILYAVTLPEVVQNYIRELLAVFPESGAEVVCPDGVYVIRDSAQEQYHIALSNVVPEYAALEDIPADRLWLKVLFAAPEATIAAMQAYVQEKHWTAVNFMQSSEVFYELLPKGITKGSALAVYRERFAPAHRVIVTAGDYENDIELLRAADWSAAPANAQDGAKAAADLVLQCSCNEGAIAEFLSVIESKIQNWR